MQIVLNSKFFNHLSVEQLGETAKQFGYDGLDICVRPNHPIHAGNVMTELPVAHRLWQQQGLTCPLATAAVDFNQPDQTAEQLYTACAEAEIPRLKIGFWQFRPGDDYWQIVDQARRSLDGFAALSRQYQVQTCYQIHSGACLGSNASGLMHLLEGFSPKEIGAYPDLGHLALDGEDWPMGLSMMGDYLSVVGIKDAFYILSSDKRQPDDKKPPYRSCFVKVGEGIVNWEQSLKALHQVGFTGPLTVHTEYQFDEAIIRQVGYADTSPPNLARWATEDAQYLRQILSRL